MWPHLYIPYIVTKAMGNNYFDLRIHTFLGLHKVFNVDLLQPYFLPLLDTSEVAEQMTSTDLKLDCMKLANIYRIMGTQVKGTHQ
jgi:hypothetical protein